MGVLHIQQKKQSLGKEICFECDVCGKSYTKNYKARLLTTKTGFFCSCKCSANWKIQHGHYEKYLNTPINRNKAQKKIRQTYSINREIVLEKIRTSSRENYGFENVSQSPLIKNKKKETVLKHFGVEHQWKVKEVRNKCHETMKKNGTYGKMSKPQKQFSSLLKSQFGEDSVKELIIVNNWEIDFFIKSINTYVQFDGVYWHGMDRKISQIKESNKQRDKAILNTMVRDRLQNKWFERNGLKLVRLTDKQFKTHGERLVKYLV